MKIKKNQNGMEELEGSPEELAEWERIHELKGSKPVPADEKTEQKKSSKKILLTEEKGESLIEELKRFIEENSKKNPVQWPITLAPPCIRPHADEWPLKHPWHPAPYIGDPIWTQPWQLPQTWCQTKSVQKVEIDVTDEPLTSGFISVLASSTRDALVQ